MRQQAKEGQASSRPILQTPKNMKINEQYRQELARLKKLNPILSFPLQENLAVAIWAFQWGS
jgi:hypothetical protein